MEKLSNTISLNRAKVKATTRVSNLYNEYTRTEETATHYDDGHRSIDVSKTADNILLFDATAGNIDKWRREKIERIDKQRAETANLVSAEDAPASKKTEEEREAWAKRSNANRTRGLRRDTVDVIGNVVQLGYGALEDLNEEEQVEAYKSAFNVLKDHPEQYGEVLVATIHKDESSMHLQCMTSCLDEKSMKSTAKSMFGNKSKMSKTQSEFVEQVNEDLKNRGLDITVNRGRQRVDNEEYRNWVDEKKAEGYDVNRYNDNEVAALDEKRVSIKQELDNADEQYSNIAMDMFDTVQDLKQTGFVYNRDVTDEDFAQNGSEAHFLRYKGNAEHDSDEYKENEAEAITDVSEFNDCVQQESPLIHVGLWMKHKVDEYSKKSRDRFKRIRAGVVGAYTDIVKTLNPRFDDPKASVGLQYHATREFDGREPRGDLLRHTATTFIEGRSKYPSKLEAAYIKAKTEEEENKRKHEVEQQLNNKPKRNNFSNDLEL